MYVKIIASCKGGTFFETQCICRIVVCLSVCLSQVDVLLKWLNVGSRKLHYIIAQGLQFSDAEDLGKTQTGSPLTEAPNAGGVG